MGIGYQAVDRKVIDYDLWFINAGRFALRGPRLNMEQIDLDETLTCIGAAQTFGRFVKRPFATQVGQMLQRQVLNLGVSGAGPEFYLQRDFLMQIIRRSGIVIVQSMSARSVSAGLFKTGANNGVLEFTEGPRKGETMLAQEAYQILRREYGENAWRDQIGAVQTQWITLHRDLASQLSGRKVFLWLSAHRPGENLRYEKSPVGGFPHFVSAEMMGEIREMFDDVVEATYGGNTDQTLVNDVSGCIETVFTVDKFPNRPNHLREINCYYATPDQHDHASALLCQKLLCDRSSSA